MYRQHKIQICSDIRLISSYQFNGQLFLQEQVWVGGGSPPYSKTYDTPSMPKLLNQQQANYQNSGGRTNKETNLPNMPEAQRYRQNQRCIPEKRHHGSYPGKKTEVHTPETQGGRSQIVTHSHTSTIHHQLATDAFRQ